VGIGYNRVEKENTMKRIFLAVLIIGVILLLGACGGPAQYTLTTSVSPEGAGAVSPANGTYDEGIELTLNAEPTSGYRFDHWSGDASGTSSSVTITIDAEKSLTAHFKAQYTLTTSVSPEGAGTVLPASGAYDEGAAVTLTAEPAEGYIFDYWDGDVSGSAATTPLSMDSNKSVTAHFRAAFVSDDGLISVVLDKLERADFFPSNFQDTSFLTAQHVPIDETLNSIQWSARPRSPKAGYDYVIIHLTLASVKVRHMGYLFVGQGDDWEANYSQVIDSEGDEHQEIGYRASGVRFGNTSHLTESYEFIEGTTVVLVFEVPKRTTPITLEFVYPFCESEFWEGWEDRSIIEWGQIEITL
jgi:uncharacterized repeat protein (TIGR02543 family)